MISPSSDLLLPPTIDWLTMSQQHDSAPELGEVSILLDADSSLELWRGRRLVQATVSADGTSASSRFTVRSAGGRVSVDFNPSKVFSPSGLDGCRSMSEVLTVCNWALAHSDVTRGKGLPPFTSSPDEVGLSSVMHQRSFSPGDLPSGPGAALSRVDVCQCWQTGSASDLRSFMVSASQNAARSGPATPYGKSGVESLYWGSKQRKVKLYSKGLELARRGEALHDVAVWATSSGLVRHEVGLRRRELCLLGLDKPFLWSESTMSDLLDSRRPFDSTAERSSVDDVFDLLVSAGCTKQRAARAQGALHAWMRGQNVKGMMPLSTWYKVVSDLRGLGFDIRAVPNVVAFKPAVRVIELKPAVLPARFRRVGFPGDEA